MLNSSRLLISINLLLANIHLFASPPAAPQIKKEFIEHNIKREDPFYWLKERDSPNVLKYLNEENTYADQHLSKTKVLQDVIFNEVKSRIKLDDTTIPDWYHGYFYYEKTSAKFDYPIYCRKKTSMSAKEELILDVNELAKKHKFMQVDNVSPSPNGKYLAYAQDITGRRIYTLHVLDIETGRPLAYKVENFTGNFVWANDSDTILYVTQDNQTLRPNLAIKSSISSGKKTKIFEEKDEAFSLYFRKDLSENYIYLESGSTDSNETYLLPANGNHEVMRTFSKRSKEIEYTVYDGDNEFIILTNLDAKNFQVMKTSKDKTDLANWVTYVKHRDKVNLSDLTVLKSHIIISEREDGYSRFKIIDRESEKSTLIKFPGSYVLATIPQSIYDTNVFLYSYESMNTPSTVYSYNLEGKKSSFVKREEVVGGYDSKKYTSKRVNVKSHDGKIVPMSLVYKSGIKLDGTNPTLIYGYGSYGITVDPGFSSSRLSLLDRGFVFAIAHVRGGAFLGESWYDDGKLLHKMNTFRDFIACSEYLIKNKYTSPKKLYAHGGSAGGLLMGAIVNMRSDLYHGVVASVPFVDVLTTMFDTSIPLTTGEFSEWGNPKDKKYYDYMKQYSPYDNVTDKQYPNLFVESGYNDSQVQYWEPTKWVARLRTLKNNTNLILLKTNMGAGHSGSSGRDSYLKEIAERYSFFLGLETGLIGPEKTTH